MTTPVSRPPTTTTSSVDDNQGDISTTNKSQTGGDIPSDNNPTEPTQITSPEQLYGIPQSQIDQALRMSGNSPYVTLRTPDGSLLVVDKSLLFSWGFATPMSSPMGDSGDIPEPGYNPTQEEVMMNQWQQGGGYGNPQGFGTSSKNMSYGGYYGPPATGGYTYGSGANPYAAYGQPGNPVYDQVLGGGAQRDQVYAQRREIRKTEHEMKIKMRIVMFQIMMGDIVGAMRTMVVESERLNKMFNRMIVSQLEKVREAKSKILTAMGRNPPPRAHDNTNNPQGAANDQNKQAKYTQWVSVTTQLMSEVQQTERELMDVLSEGRRNINDLWEAYSGMKEAEARTTRTVIQSFRG
jgi:hypothetical protein